MCARVTARSIHYNKNGSLFSHTHARERELFMVYCVLLCAFSNCYNFNRVALCSFFSLLLFLAFFYFAVAIARYCYCCWNIYSVHFVGVFRFHFNSFSLGGFEWIAANVFTVDLSPFLVQIWWIIRFIWILLAVLRARIISWALLCSSSISVAVRNEVHTEWKTRHRFATHTPIKWQNKPFK